MTAVAPLVTAHDPAPDREELLTAMRSYLHLSRADELRLWVNLAVAVSADLPEGEEPAWLMNVAASSAGKNQITDLMREVRQRELSDITLAGLLTFRQRTNPETSEKYSVAAGLLPELEGQRALVVVKDMSSVLGADARSGSDRADLFACLREVFDGSYSRDNAHGSYTWRGKLTLVANVTPAVDRYAAHMNSLGTRWMFFRSPPRQKGDMAAVSDLIRGVPRDARAEARERAVQAATRLVRAARERVAGHDAIDEEVVDQLAAASVVAAFGRRHVPRETWGRREICGMVEEEDSPRLFKQLLVLARCLYALGLGDHEVQFACRWVAIGSMPVSRWLAIEAVRRQPGSSGHSVARATGLDRMVTKYTLGDLRAIGLLKSDPEHDEDAPPGAAVEWRVADEWLDDFELAFGPARGVYEIDD